MLLAHKIELRPTPSQADYLIRACGSRRHCYNQLLDHFQRPGEKWSKAAAYQYFITVIRPAFPWYNEVSSRVTRNAIEDLDSAFQHFFRRVKEKKPVAPKAKTFREKYGYPVFKKKGKKESFALRESNKFDVDGRTLRIERLKTRIDLRQPLRFSGKTKQVTISQRADRFYASVLVDTEDYNPHAPKDEAVGIDFGIKSLAVLSDGTTFPANQKLKANLRRLKRRNRRLSKKVNGSRRRMKAQRSLAKLHKRIADQRQAVLHEVSDYVTRHYRVVCLEDLNVRGMVKNHNLARSVSDAGFGTLRQMIEYKAALRGGQVIIVNRFAPSSKMCCQCGQLHEMPLSVRVMDCDCGNVMDRDQNAANNILKFGLDTFTPDLKRTQESCKTPVRRGNGSDGVKMSMSNQLILID
jgi:putative transposase